MGHFLLLFIVPNYFPIFNMASLFVEVFLWASFWEIIIHVRKFKIDNIIPYACNFTTKINPQILNGSPKLNLG
jgi:hypothetical protein